MNMAATNEGYSLLAGGHVLIALLLSACTSSMGNIPAQYVPPEKYQGLTCREIGAEGEHVASRVAEISGDAHSNTAGAARPVAPPIVVHWPTPWLATSEEGIAELSKLRGEFEALEQAAERKRCGLSFKQQASTGG
jgi:hypothetical protein